MNKQTKKNRLDTDLTKIINAKHHDPFSILGRHKKGKKTQITVFLPHAESVTLADSKQALQRIPETDLFEYSTEKDDLPDHYLLQWLDKDGVSHENYDPYNFGPQLSDMDQHLFFRG